MADGNWPPPPSTDLELDELLQQDTQGNQATLNLESSSTNQMQASTHSNSFETLELRKTSTRGSKKSKKLKASESESANGKTNEGVSKKSEKSEEDFNESVSDKTSVEGTKNSHQLHEDWNESVNDTAESQV